MKMKNNKQTLIAGIITLVLLFLIISIFFFKKNKTNFEAPTLDKINQEVEEKDFDLTLIKPKQVFEAIRKDEFLIIDTREKGEFEETHIESSKNIPIDKLSTTSLPKDKTLIIIEREETLNGQEIASKLKESGYQLNYLEGGLFNYLTSGFTLVSSGDSTSIEDAAKSTSLDLETLGKRLLDGERFIYLDIRKKTDFEKNYFEKSINIPLEELEKRKSEIPSGKILIIDENPIRSFKASVRLTDMNILTNYYLTNPYSELKSAVENQTLFNE